MKHLKALVKKAALLSLLCLLPDAAFCGSIAAGERYEMNYADTVRTYLMYIPETALEGAPLVVYTHGYGSKTRWREDLNEAARRHGFAVCYPDGAPDSKGRDSWFVGYPSQSGMDRHEENFFRALLDEVCGRFRLSRENVFLTGFSNGGDLCYHLAYTDPGLFKAYASISGLTFSYAYDNYKLGEPVHFLEIHGNDDNTSMWYGDHLGTGGWGPYIPVPLAVAAIAANNRCSSVKTSSFQRLSEPGKKVNVTIYSDSPSGKDVVLYEIEGGKHNWNRTDIDTAELICEFFDGFLEKSRAQEIYSNPVIRLNCPDPTVLDDRDASGWFWLYSTQTAADGNVRKDSSPAVAPGSMASGTGTDGITNTDTSGGGSKVINLPIYRSKDLVHWEFVCDGFPDGKPAWVKDSKLWAPDINRFDGKYVLYYALGVWGGVFKEGSGVAVADSPGGPFTDKGKVVDYKSMGTLNSIDPNFFDDGDRRYLLWGSLGGGIDIVRLSDDGMSVHPKAKKKHLAARNIEGAYLYKKGGRYYLFASKGSCCKGEKSTYRLVVARADRPEGPYYGPDGQKFTSMGYDNVIMQGGGDGKFIGPGHNAQIITDRNGRDWMLFHSYWKDNGYKGRCLMLEELHWDKDGWPYFPDGIPSSSAVAPVF